MSNAPDGSWLDRHVDRDMLYQVGLYVVMYGIAILFFVPYWRMFQLSVTPMSVIAEGIPLGAAGVHARRLATVPPRGTGHLPLDVHYLPVAGLTTALVLVVDSMVAFPLTRLDWPGKSAISGVIVASFTIPGYVNVIPLYTLVNDLGLMNSYWAIVLPAVTVGPATLGAYVAIQGLRSDRSRIDRGHIGCVLRRNGVASVLLSGVPVAFVAVALLYGGTAVAHESLPGLLTVAFTVAFAGLAFSFQLTVVDAVDERPRRTSADTGVTA